MAGKANVSAVETVEQDEVSASRIAPATEKGVTNGLGLELLFTNAPKAKSSSTPKPKAKEVVEDKDEVETDEVELEPKDEKKEIPAKDPKTGRFLSKKTLEPPVEDAKDGEDATALKKRLKDTRDWATKINQQNEEWKAKFSKMESEFKVLQAKADGTYDENAAPKVDPVELAKLQERTKISKAIAEKVYGHELVKELVFDEDSPYRALEQMDPMVKAKVFNSEEPVMEAIRQLKWKKMVDQYGQDPDEIVEKLREELKAELVEAFKQKGRSKRTIEDVDGLSGMNGGDGDEDRVTHVKSTKIDLAASFPGFPTGHF
mgnify:FL=1